MSTLVRKIAPSPLGLIVIGYLGVFLLLDWASFIRPWHGLNITPWNPQPALAVALLLARRRLWWLVLLGLLAAELMVRELPGNLGVALVAAACLTACCLAMAAAMAHVLGPERRLVQARDLVALLVIIASGAFLGACLYVGIYAADGAVAERRWWEAVGRYWVGDAVGLTVTLPVLLVLMDPRGRTRLAEIATRPEAWLVAGLTSLVPWLLFSTRGDFDVSYLMLLPVIWAAMRFGLPGAVLACALTQVGLLAAVQGGQQQDSSVFELQLLMAAVTMTALLLGAVIDERAQADAELKRSLRLAAAGQMTAAMAHELSQPLNALALNAQSFRLLAAEGEPMGPDQRRRLMEVVQRMASDAQRAGDVVRRLRDFFRSGTTQLQSTALAELAEQALAAQRARAQAVGAELRQEVAPGLPALWIDRVQIEVVLRNLLANALDAASGPDAQRPVAVRLRATPAGGEVLVELLDSGPGLDAASREAVFEPGFSSKADGMGVGLGICRAIVEAHGGRLWAAASDHGHFCFTLPLDGGTERDPGTRAP